MKKVLIFGGSGLVGSYFKGQNKDNFEITSPTVETLDILNRDAVLKFIEESNCDNVINFAAFTNVEAAEKEKDDKNGICYKINVIGARNVALVCKDLNKYLIHISTDYVFDGTKSSSPYQEEDKPNPINWYGATKYFGEQFVLKNGGRVAIVRICMPFSPKYELKKDIARFFLGRLQQGKEIRAIDDQKITPTIVSDIAGALKVLLEKEIKGIYHVCSKDSTTPYDFARLVAQKCSQDESLIRPVSLDEYNKGKQAKLLKYSWLSSDRFRKKFGEGVIHSIEQAVELFCKLTGTP
jgi:dTDP-4-dehydrorhamnose reductase